jgi:glycosyltransferase involved in cell wall biosynthesis
MNTLLSVIIPFLNEGNEVENTLESIRTHSNDNVEIILINDASTDNFDYKSTAEKYGALYIINEERMGVAASRDKGVSLCTTPYFLLLDAHMRFYDNQWVDKIIYQLKSTERIVLCCQTKILGVENGFVVENNASATMYGAYIDFQDRGNLLGSSWTSLKYPHYSNLNIVPIACILGAGYACSKKYWEYLKGLEGLLYYGSDETYLSLKVWLEGGKCLLLEDVIIGHIYRNRFPYQIEYLYILYNRMLIAELLVPPIYAKKIFSITKNDHITAYNEILLLLRKSKKQISQLKTYYRQILKNDFNDFLRLNKLVYIQKNKSSDPNEILKKIAHSLIIDSQSITDLGIIGGRMSIILFLFHYSEYLKERIYHEIAETLLDNLVDELHADQSVFFYSGLSGIGWGIEYLYQNGFIKGDMNEILRELDEKIMEINPLKIKDLELNYGLGGIVHYILARLYTVHRENKENPFDECFLKNLYYRIESIIENKTDCDSIDVFIKFETYYNLNILNEKLSLYDIACFPENYIEKNCYIGLYGSAGIGLKLIFEKDEE